MAWLFYLWCVLANLFYLAVVAWVFNELEGRRDTIAIVAVLGLLYVTIRSIACGQALGLAQAGTAIQAHFVRIRELLGDDRPFPDDLEKEKKTTKMLRIKIYIDLTFLWLISLLCLYHILREHHPLTALGLGLNLARARMSFTCTGVHCPPRAVAMPRAAKARAMPRKDLMPLA